MALAANAALYAGRIHDTRKDVKPKGILRLISLADGKKLSDTVMDCPPAYDGLAVVEGKVYVTLENGAWFKSRRWPVTHCRSRLPSGTCAARSRSASGTYWLLPAFEPCRKWDADLLGAVGLAMRPGPVRSWFPP